MSADEVRHPDAHTDALEGILASSGDPLDAFVKSELAACQACRERLDEIMDTRNLMNAVGRQVRREVESELPDDEVVGDELVERVLGPRAAPDTPAGPRAIARPLRFLAAGLAAAAVLVLGVYLANRPPSTPAGILGTEGGIELGQPIGAVAAWDRFTWSGAVPANGWARIVVSGTAPDGTRRELARSSELESSSWSPRAGESDDWPERITWELRIYDASGEQVDSLSAESWLQSD